MELSLYWGLRDGVTPLPPPTQKGCDGNPKLVGDPLVANMGLCPQWDMGTCLGTDAAPQSWEQSMRTTFGDVV